MFRFLFCLALMVVGGSHAFAPSPAFSTGARVASSLLPAATASDATGSSAAGEDAKEVIGRRLTVTGGVQGGYYRSCVRNEASRFRNLVGTMSPPEDGVDEAEIYIEGTRKMVDGFIRWAQKGDVGLSVYTKVTGIVEEEPTGLYETFYVKTK